MSARGPQIVPVDELELNRWLSPGDGVMIGQGCAEPVPLVDALLLQASGIGPLSAFIGMAYGDRLVQHASPTIRVVSYCAFGGVRGLPGLEVVPCHFSALPRLFAQGKLPGDVALIQVAPPDQDGRCSLGAGVDYLADAASHARIVIAEVNDQCPRSTGAWLDWDELDVVVRTSRSLLEAPTASPTPIDRAIADHVAQLVSDGDTVQLGVGALPEAIIIALRDHRRLGVHSGMISDGILDLIACGAVTGQEKPTDTCLTVTGAALGTKHLFDALEQRDDIVLRPVSYTHSPVALAQVGPLCAINSALEVDLSGQVNSESINGRQLGAVGGQMDFLRAAAASGGKAIVALPASRIVGRLHGPASTPAADIDWIVTEYGARSLSALSAERKMRALLEIAGPHADDLVEAQASPTNVEGAQKAMSEAQ